MTDDTDRVTRLETYRRLEYQEEAGYYWALGSSCQGSRLQGVGFGEGIQLEDLRTRSAAHEGVAAAIAGLLGEKQICCCTQTLSPKTLSL